MPGRIDKAKTLPKKKEGFFAQDFGTEVVLCDEESRRVHVLNKTAQMIWERCDGTTRIEELVEEMSRAFSDVTKKTLEGDLEKTLGVLYEQKLVE